MDFERVLATEKAGCHGEPHPRALNLLHKCLEAGLPAHIRANLRRGGEWLWKSKGERSVVAAVLEHSLCPTANKLQGKLYTIHLLPHQDTGLLRLYGRQIWLHKREASIYHVLWLPELCVTDVGYVLDVLFNYM